MVYSNTRAWFLDCGVRSLLSVPKVKNDLN